MIPSGRVLRPRPEPLWVSAIRFRSRSRAFGGLCPPSVGGLHASLEEGNSQGPCRVEFDISPNQVCFHVPKRLRRASRTIIRAICSTPPCLAGATGITLRATRLPTPGRGRGQRTHALDPEPAPGTGSDLLDVRGGVLGDGQPSASLRPFGIGPGGWWVRSREGSARRKDLTTSGQRSPASSEFPRLGTREIGRSQRGGHGSPASPEPRLLHEVSSGTAGADGQPAGRNLRILEVLARLDIDAEKWQSPLAHLRRGPWLGCFLAARRRGRRLEEVFETAGEHGQDVTQSLERSEVTFGGCSSGDVEHLGGLRPRQALEMAKREHLAVDRVHPI